MSSNNPQSLVRARSISPEWRALHALWCCGAISIRVAGPLLTEFGALVTRGWAQPRTRFPADGRTTYKLTDAGRALARDLF